MPVLALDLNSFFASVEQQERPELRDRPVAVAPVLADTSCCIAASYPAKTCGVKTGTGVAEARRLCPDVVIVEARPALYVHYHERIKTVVDRWAPIVAVPSIDEFTCELPAGWQSWERAAELGRRIKRAILEEVGASLRCSVGIAPNAYLAKTACDMHKPDGLTVLRPEDLPQALFRLELRDLCGIGPNLERRLRAAGIHTVERLCAASKLELRKVWGGIGGEQMYDDLRGLASHAQPTERRSVGHSHVLPPELRSDAGAHAVIHRMLQKAAMRLRRLALSAGGMQIAVHDLGEHHRGWGVCGWHAEGRFVHTDDTLALGQHLETLWKRRPRAARKTPPLQVGVVLFDLIATGHETLPLFPDDRPRTRLLETVDRVNLRFGKNTLYFGAAHAARDRSPTRIAFTRIPDIAVE